MLRSDRAPAMATLIMTAELNDIGPQAWLADLLVRLPDHPAKQIDELLHGNGVDRIESGVTKPAQHGMMVCPASRGSDAR